MKPVLLGEKNAFSHPAIFYRNTIDLPRQARDSHRKRWKTKNRFVQATVLLLSGSIQMARHSIRRPSGGRTSPRL